MIHRQTTAHRHCERSKWQPSVERWQDNRLSRPESVSFQFFGKSKTNHPVCSVVWVLLLSSHISSHYYEDATNNANMYTNNIIYSCERLKWRCLIPIILNSLIRQTLRNHYLCVVSVRYRKRQIRVDDRRCRVKMQHIVPAKLHRKRHFGSRSRRLYSFANRYLCRNLHLCRTVIDIICVGNNICH